MMKTLRALMLLVREGIDRNILLSICQSDEFEPVIGGLLACLPNMDKLPNDLEKHVTIV